MMPDVISDSIQEDASPADPASVIVASSGDVVSDNSVLTSETESAGFCPQQPERQVALVHPTSQVLGRLMPSGMRPGLLATNEYDAIEGQSTDVDDDRTSSDDTPADYQEPPEDKIEFSGQTRSSVGPTPEKSYLNNYREAHSKALTYLAPRYVTDTGLSGGTARGSDQTTKASRTRV
ncbi:unnamed protein product [Protopolystoma xenopodis]|uniref:Uncharacterized protein n=1 Tax=Protopolystoma xenopodis TaxID=117903 RepID=A0A448X1J2_9PLAT|nr:unnamed protein product [Protopolystoma xenopodis]